MNYKILKVMGIYLFILWIDIYFVLVALGILPFIVEGQADPFFDTIFNIMIIFGVVMLTFGLMIATVLMPKYIRAVWNESIDH